MTTFSNELVGAVDSVSRTAEENSVATKEMMCNSNEVTRAIENIASVSEENSASVEEVSASAEEMSAQVEEVTASAQNLAETAQELQQLVSRFQLANQSSSALPAKTNGKPQSVMHASGARDRHVIMKGKVTPMPKHLTGELRN
jgi:hypothetical protein